MIATYKGRSYRQQQLWSLVAALNADGYSVKLLSYTCTGWWAKVSLTAVVDYKEQVVMSAIRRGENGDRTPFRALMRVVERIESIKRKEGQQ